MIDAPARAKRPARLAGALAAGALLALSFPPFGLGALAWVAIAPLLWALEGATARQAAGRGYAAGIVFMAGVGWFTTSFGGHVLWMRLLPWILFTLIEALWFIPIGLLLAAVLRRAGPWGVLAAAPAVWVLGEWVRGAGAFGFPFGYLAYAAAGENLAIQTARLGGCWMVSYLVALAGAAVYLCGRGRWRPVVAGLAVVAAAFAWGEWMVVTAGDRDRGEWARVVVVQGSENLPWGAPGRDEDFRQIQRLSTEPAWGRWPVDLIVWSESTLPGPFTDPGVRAAVAGVARSRNAPVLTGSILFTPDGDPTNVALLVEPDGRVAGKYQKRRLVPFGEWVPLRHVLPLLDSFGVVERDEVPGRAWTVLRSGPLALGVPICFESASPEASRAFARRGANLLCILTNDGWFGGTGMAEMHARLATLRAVETGLWVVRGAHTGISGAITPIGDWTRTLRRGQAGSAICLVRLASGGTTPYVRYGDWFPALCVILALIGLIRRGSRTPSTT